ncbi:MAG TPA: DegT/DnrJ/EryC1/StrS family aminotransferase [Chloroflexota bacterium]|jgi:8-amino-3,8-dideoxy-alpha-D-manno-octulosonate transaminase
MPQTMARLAIDGGAPVRTEKLPHYRGAALYGESERAAVLEVVEAASPFRYDGPRLLGKTAAFERKLAEMTGARFALGLASGTAALRAGLAALDVGPGDEVVVPAVTFIASVSAVIAQGAVPRFAEVDESFTLDPERLEAAIEPRTKAIMPVHLSGTPTRMERIVEIARGRGLTIIEDCAQAGGVTYRGRSVGRHGDLGALSFQVSKNLSSGEGGALITDDPRLQRRAAQYQDQGGQYTLVAAGPDEVPGEPLLGENLRMTEFAGAVLGAQLDRLPGIASSVRAVRDRILAGLRDLSGITLPPRADPDGEIPTGILFFVADGDLATRVVAAINAEGVYARKVYGGRPVYANPALLEQRTIHSSGRPFSDPLYLAKGPPITYRLGMCPRSEDLLARSVVVGVNGAYTERDVVDVVTAIRKVVQALMD